MLIKVRRGSYDPETQIEPDGDELWTGGDDGLSAAALNAMNSKFELGTWYPLREFNELVTGLRPPQEREVMSAITVDQLGVSASWSSAIEIGEDTAALMICQSVADHVRRLQIQGSVWVRVE
jgi:hypothetical protein